MFSIITIGNRNKKWLNAVKTWITHLAMIITCCSGVSNPSWIAFYDIGPRWTSSSKFYILQIFKVRWKARLKAFVLSKEGNWLQLKNTRHDNRLTLGKFYCDLRYFNFLLNLFNFSWNFLQKLIEFNNLLKVLFDLQSLKYYSIHCPHLYFLINLHSKNGQAKKLKFKINLIMKLCNIMVYALLNCFFQFTGKKKQFIIKSVNLIFILWCRI